MDEERWLVFSEEEKRPDVKSDIPMKLWRCLGERAVDFLTR